MMNSSLFLFLCFVAVIALSSNSVSASNNPFSDPNRCVSVSDDFIRRNAAQIGMEQANRLESGNLWKQSASVVAKVPVDPEQTVFEWHQVVAFDFWQDSRWESDESCRWTEDQAWPRVDANTGEFMFAFQRIYVTPQEPTYQFDTSSNPPQLVEKAQSYSVEWEGGRYLEESAIIIGTYPVEYALGDKVVSAGWYRNDGQLPYVNTLINYVDQWYRTYTANTILQADPNDPFTQYKVMADIQSTSVIPPALVTEAFQWFDSALSDPNYQPEINPVTFQPEYIFRPSQHSTAAKRNSLTNNSEAAELNTQPTFFPKTHEELQLFLSK